MASKTLDSGLAAKRVDPFAISFHFSAAKVWPWGSWGWRRRDSGTDVRFSQNSSAICSSFLLNSTGRRSGASRGLSSSWSSLGRRQRLWTRCKTGSILFAISLHFSAAKTLDSKNSPTHDLRFGFNSTAQVEDLAEQRLGLGEVGGGVEDPGLEVLAELLHDLQEIRDEEQELGQQEAVLGVVVDEVQAERLDQVRLQVLHGSRAVQAWPL